MCGERDIDVVAVKPTPERPGGYSLEWVHVAGRRCIEDEAPSAPRR